MENYAARDQEGRVAFYVLLWKRKGISLRLFDDYWRNVHGPVCARLPGQFQYWQLHVAHNEGGVWPQLPGITYSTPEDGHFDGIAELTFKSEEDRTRWFHAAAILMDDEHNLFRKAIGYNTSPGNSITYIDRIQNGAPNGRVSAEKFHVMLRKTESTSVADFRKYLTDTLGPAAAGSESVMKFRLHLFEEVDGTRPEAAGVAHAEPFEENYQAAFEIAFADRLALETFFASEAYQAATREQPKYIRQISPFPERSAYTFVHNSQMTLGGQRSSTVAELITSIGATNQLRDDISSLMLGGPVASKVGA